MLQLPRHASSSGQLALHADLPNTVGLARAEPNVVIARPIDLRLETLLERGHIRESTISLSLGLMHLRLQVHKA